MLSPKLAHKKILFIVISILIIVLAGVWLKNSTDNTARELESSPAIIENGEIEDPEDALIHARPEHYMNIMLLGLDEKGLSDQIMIAAYNLETNQVILISISRNTYVSDQTWSEPGMGLSHLCFANYAGLGEEKDYHQGAELTALWLEHMLGIRIDEYASIDYDSFVELIDLIGGVKVYIDPAFADVWPSRNDRIRSPLPTGLQHINGEQALYYSRYRGDQTNKPRIDEPGSDSTDDNRIRRNQRLLKAIYEQARSIRMLKLLPILKELPNHIHTSLTVWDITAFAPLVYRASPNEVITLVLPGEFVEVYEEIAGEYTHYYYLDYERSNEMLEGFGLKHKSYQELANNAND